MGSSGIIQRYKAPEGSMLERASLLRLENDVALIHEPGKLILDIENTQVGENLNATLTLKRRSGYTYPKELTLAISALAAEYTGRGRTVLGNVHASLVPSAAETAGLSLKLPTTGPAFATLLTG